MVTITLYMRQQKRHWCIDQSFGLCGRGRGWDDLGEWHWNMYNIIYGMSCQSRFNARYWMLGAGALGWPRGRVWGGRREEGSGWGTHVYLWWIHFHIWQNQYNIVKFKNKIKLKKKQKKTKTQQSVMAAEVPFGSGLGSLSGRGLHVCRDAQPALVMPFPENTKKHSGWYGCVDASMWKGKSVLNWVSIYSSFHFSEEIILQIPVKSS